LRSNLLKDSYDYLEENVKFSMMLFLYSAIIITHYSAVIISPLLPTSYSFSSIKKRERERRGVFAAIWK